MNALGVFFATKSLADWRQAYSNPCPLDDFRIIPYGREAPPGSAILMYPPLDKAASLSCGGGVVCFIAEYKNILDTVLQSSLKTGSWSTSSYKYRYRRLGSFGDCRAEPRFWNQNYSTTLRIWIFTVWYQYGENARYKVRLSRGTGITDTPAVFHRGEGTVKIPALFLLGSSELTQRVS